MWPRGYPAGHPLRAASNYTLTELKVSCHVDLMRKRLTPRSIDALQPAVGKRYEVRDELVVGLVLRVSPTGGKVWYVVARVEAVLRRIKLGTYPVVGLADAREKARDLLRRIQLGEYAEPVPEQRLPTFGETVPQFIALYAKPRNRSWRESERFLGRFSELNDKPLGAVKRTDVVRVVDAIMARGTAPSANRALAAIKKLFAWCLDRGVIDHNPVAGLKPPAKEVFRDRVLTDTELVAIWQTAEAEGFPFGPFVQLLTLTGQRRGEVAEMAWSEIDLANAIWTIPARRAKNGTQHVVPLSPLAMEILSRVPRFVRSDLVLTTTGTTAISGFSRFKLRLDEAVGASDWRVHDLRRTVATNMAMMGVQPHVIEAVLNHRSGIVSGVAAVYNRHTYAQEKREALTRWSDRVADLVGGSFDVDRRDQREALLVSAGGF